MNTSNLYIKARTESDLKTLTENLLLYSFIKKKYQNHSNNGVILNIALPCLGILVAV